MEKVRFLPHSSAKMFGIMARYLAPNSLALHNSSFSQMKQQLLVKFHMNMCLYYLLRINVSRKTNYYLGKLLPQSSPQTSLRTRCHNSARMDSACPR